MRLHCHKYIQPILYSVGLFEHLDNVGVQDKVKTEQDSNEDSDSGWDRLKKMYSYNKSSSVSPQMAMVTDGSLTALTCGFVIGAIADSKEAYLTFVENHKLTSFDHQIEAKRRLQDHMLMAMMRGGWRVGWRLGLITTSVLVILTTLHTYRGWSSVFDFSAAAAASCGIYKLKHGPKPAVAGCIVGAGMGTFAGSFVLGLMKLSGVSFQDFYIMDADRIAKHDRRKADRRDRYRAEKMEELIMYRTDEEVQDDASGAEKSVNTDKPVDNNLMDKTVKADQPVEEIDKTLKADQMVENMDKTVKTDQPEDKT